MNEILKAVERMNDCCALGVSKWRFDPESRKVATWVEGVECRLEPKDAIHVARILSPTDRSRPMRDRLADDRATVAVSLSTGPGFTAPLGTPGASDCEYLVLAVRVLGESLRDVAKRALSTRKPVAGDDAAG